MKSDKLSKDIIAESNEISKNIIIEMTGASDADKETLIDYFDKKEISDLFIEYDILDINEITKMQIANILTVLESYSEEQ